MSENTNKKVIQQNNNYTLISRDEMNLAEFPLTVLSTRVNPKIKTLEFKDKVINKNGKEINREWIITGTDKFGLPTSSDDEVLLGLLKLSVDQKFESKKIIFTRYELLKILRWSAEGKNYQRLQKALDRLSGVRIKATNAFFDNELKAHSTKNFGIIDAYEINDGRENRHKPSFFVWSDEIFNSFQSGYIKKLDLDFFLDLKSAVSKRLYRFLDKNFWYRSRLKTNLFILCHEKIGVSRNYKYASSLKQQIEPALEELIEVGFISEVEYQGKGKNTEIIITAANSTPRSQIKSEDQQEAEKLATTKVTPISQKIITKGLNLTETLKARLQERGIKPHQLDKLLVSKSDYQLRKVEKLLEYYDHLVRSNSSLISVSPIGFLYRAVEKIDDFTLPKEFSLKKPCNKTNKNNKKAEENKKLEAEYQSFFDQEVNKAKNELEPAILAKITKDVEDRLANVKNLVSADRFAETLSHGIKQQIARTYDVPDFSEWKKQVKKPIS